MELLPGAKVRKPRKVESPCFSLLRKIYNRIPALQENTDVTISNRFRELRKPYMHLEATTDRVESDQQHITRELIRNTYGSLASSSSKLPRPRSILGSLFVASQSTDVDSKRPSSKSSRPPATAPAERISPELLNSLRASSDSALPNFMDRRSDSRFRHLAPSSYQDHRGAEFDEAAFENQLRSSLAEGDDIAEDLLVVIETTTGITRDLEIYLRRFVLEGDAERRAIVDAVKRYRDELKLALDTTSQVRIDIYEDMFILLTG
jgi:hypothetical protein